LIKKGNRSEQSVFPPRAKPVIRAAKVSDAPSRQLTAPESAALESLLRQNKTLQEECDVGNEFTLTQLDERHVLISTLCWRNGFNENYAYWVADSALENSPKFVTHRGSGYNHDDGNGWIHSRIKGRELGDCLDEARWLWDGKAFRLSSQWTSGMCRFIHAGGAWRLPTFVADVINADGTSRAPDRFYK
jgi:hypothetical protein